MRISKCVDVQIIYFYNNNLLAKYKGKKKPKQSVKVVMMIDDATAGSIPKRFNNKGIDAPVRPAIMRLPVMAKNNTTPSMGLAS